MGKTRTRNIMVNDSNMHLFVKYVYCQIKEMSTGMIKRHNSKIKRLILRLRKLFAKNSGNCQI